VAPRYQAAIVRLCGTAAGRPTAGLGLLVGSEQVMTCAHVVNNALGRSQREQSPPSMPDRVLVEFPLLPKTPVRLARVVTWVPPPLTGAGGGDVAGLALTEEAPADAVPAQFAATPPEPGTRMRVFGYPGEPPRETGMWVDVDLMGEVAGQLIQVESRRDQTVKAQSGYSGSPVWDHRTGKAVGLLQAAPFPDEPQRDAYLLPSLAVAQAWEQHFDYLLIPENPYRGLEPFTAEHAPVYFGRDVDIEALSSLVRRRPVVVVVGPSGVGKSSLVQAGLIPALQQQQSWSIVLVRPGQDPWLRLAAALLRAQNGTEKPVTRRQSEQESDLLRTKGFASVARFLRSENRPLLLVVDQFEELLASDGQPDEGLLHLLLPQPEDAESALRIVLVLRADFQPALQSIPGFHTRLNGRLYLLSPLTPVQMRQVITRPAAARSVHFEEGLIDRILTDAAGGTLPLLEFTLSKLWESQRHKTLTFAGYYQMGGVLGALNRFADEKAAQFAETAAHLFDQVLLKLVLTPLGSADLAVRQRVFQSEVLSAEWQLLQRLAEARLVTLSTESADRGPYAELAHESLITAWRRLSGLVAENAEFLNWLARVQHRAAEEDPLPEARIAEARRWLDLRPQSIPSVVKTFIKNSETTAEARLRELRHARDRAEKAREQAEALRLAADAELALRSARPATVIALALGVESVLTLPTPQGSLALRHVLRLHPGTLARIDHDGLVSAVAFSPDGTRIVTASSDSARLFDAATGNELARFEHDGYVSAVVFSPDGTRIATASGDLVEGPYSARVFDAATGNQLVRLDHDDLVNAVAFSPDGTQVATGSWDHSARVFDAASGAMLARLDHDGRVHVVAFSPDGTRIATGSSDSARVFDVATENQLALIDHYGDVYEVAFSPDGTRIATSSLDPARVFDAATGAELARLGRDRGVNAVAFSPDGTQIATAAWDSARVFDAATGIELARLGHGSMVNAVAFSPDGTQIATASNDHSARVFDAATGAELARLDHDGAVNAVAFSPDGTRIATASGDGSARIFNPATARAELARLDHDGEVNAVAFSPDGTRIATASGDGSARIFNRATGAELARLNHDLWVNAVAFSPDGTRVATASGDESMRVFDAGSGAELTRVDHGQFVEVDSDGTRAVAAVNAVAFSPDGTRIATASDDHSAWVFDAATGAELARLDHDGAVNAVAFSPDGTRIATVSWDYSARVFDAATGAELAQLGHGVDAVAFSPDGTRIATASGRLISAPSSAPVFDAATGDQLIRLDHDGRVHAVAFSPDGTRIATASEDGSARVFDAASGAELARLDHDGDVYAVAFSPDGTRVATASRDGSARVFDAATSVELARLDHDGEVKAVAFSPDGTRVATASRDGSARVFETMAKLLVERALDRMTRPLNPAELRRYSLQSDCRHVKEWISRESDN
jgi:WD40 repeat protein